MFLALGLGILVGTTVLDDSLVNSLRDRTERLQTQADDLRAQLEAAQGRAAAAEQVQPFAFANELLGQPVVLVTADGVDGDTLGEARSALDLAGARTVTTLAVQPEAAASNAADQQDLAELLQLPADTAPQELSAEAADRLAIRLATPPARTGEVAPDLLGEMLDLGYVTAPGLSEVDLPDVGGAGQVVVVVGGGSGASALTSDAFLTPLVSGLTGTAMSTAAGEGSDPASAFVASARDAADDDAALVTVDGLDLPEGGTALVLGIANLLETGDGGAYGVGPDAAQLFPPFRS